MAGAFKRFLRPVANSLLEWLPPDQCYGLAYHLAERLPSERCDAVAYCLAERAMKHKKLLNSLTSDGYERRNVHQLWNCGSSPLPDRAGSQGNFENFSNRLETKRGYGAVLGEKARLQLCLR